MECVQDCEWSACRIVSGVCAVLAENDMQYLMLTHTSFKDGCSHTLFLKTILHSKHSVLLHSKHSFHCCSPHAHVWYHDSEQEYS